MVSPDQWVPVKGREGKEGEGKGGEGEGKGRGRGGEGEGKGGKGREGGFYTYIQLLRITNV